MHGGRAAAGRGQGASWRGREQGKRGGSRTVEQGGSVKQAGGSAWRACWQVAAAPGLGGYRGKPGEPGVVQVRGGGREREGGMNRARVGWRRVSGPRLGSRRARSRPQARRASAAALATRGREVIAADAASARDGLRHQPLKLRWALLHHLRRLLVQRVVRVGRLRQAGRTGRRKVQDMRRSTGYPSSVPPAMDRAERHGASGGQPGIPRASLNPGPARAPAAPRSTQPRLRTSRGRRPRGGLPRGSGSGHSGQQLGLGSYLSAAPARAQHHHSAASASAAPTRKRNHRPEIIQTEAKAKQNGSNSKAAGNTTQNPPGRGS